MAHFLIRNEFVCENFFKRPPMLKSADDVVIY
jgi:hypothetical protein